MPSNFTQNYQLSQWEATDQVCRTDFNADNTKIDAALKTQADALSTAAAAIPKVAVGSYAGDGAESRTIPLPFTPKAVLLMTSGGVTSSSGYAGGTLGGLAVTGNPVVYTWDTAVYYAVEITSGGFKVMYKPIGEYANVLTNHPNIKYNYIAIG